jgi:hypothetical protein
MRCCMFLDLYLTNNAKIIKADMESRVGYVANTSGRSTLKLVWSCLVTIGLCTWTVQHPNVVPFTKQRIPALVRKRLFWMTLTLFCPEYVTYIAIDQWQNARKYEQIQKLGHPDFTIKHGFYVAMGGLIVRTYDDATVGAGEKDDSSTKRGVPQDHGIYMDDLIILVREKILEPPRISLHSLEERSKTDNFARFITIGHVIIFIISTIGRLASGLPISLLEVGTLAFVFCAACIEFFWWNKPLDLRTSTIIELNAEKSQEFRAKSEDLPLCPSEQTLGELADYGLFWRRMIESPHSSRRAVHIAWIGCIFNCIHIVAWNVSFPTLTEGWIWRIASIVACIAIICDWLIFFMKSHRLAMTLAFAVLSPVYLAARMYLLVEACIGLRSVPKSMYDRPAWQNEMPFL